MTNASPTHAPRRWLFLGKVLAAALAVAFVWHTLQAAEHAHARGEVHARLADVRAQRIAALEAELTSALGANEGVRAFVHERIAAEAAERTARTARLQSATQPLPDGLRLAIETLHDLLRRAGHQRLRVLSLRAIEAKEMRGVELFEAPDDLGGGVTLWSAARAELHLDRTTSALRMRLHDGYVVRNGKREALGDGGEVLLLPGVDGPAFEERLPYLVVADGAYPVPEPRVPPKAKLDPFTAQRWRERLNQLLADSTSALSYRVTEIEGLAEGEFLGVVLLGQLGKRVEQMAEVDRLAVVVDDAAQTVELELIGGVLRRAGGDTKLPSTPPGQRILLAGLTPQAAARALTGMVVRR